MLMDPPVMQMDCQLQNDVEKTPSIAYDQKHTMSHDDYGWTGSDVHTTNEATICRPVEANNASQTCVDEVIDSSLENSPENSQGLELRKAKNSDDSCSNDVRLQLSISMENNGLQSEDVDLNKHSKEDAHHPQEEMHPPLLSSSPNLCKFNGGAMPSQGEKIAEDGVKVDGNVDAERKKYGANLVGCHPVHIDLQCTLEDLSEVACSIDLVRNKSSMEEEKETSVSPINGMDQLFHNNRCNGDTNCKESELVTGNAGDEEDHAVALWVKENLVSSATYRTNLGALALPFTNTPFIVFATFLVLSLDLNTSCAHSQPFHVKQWRGKWQTGIRCCRADCPLPTLKAKPTHDRKSYIVVFFPRTRTYSWVDMLLVLPIEESPLPLVNGTHRKWRKLVKDLSVPRRFIMQKIAISMLNLSDELHIEAVIENARKAAYWKEFALEASCSRDYTDLGKMLIKLQNVIPGTLFHVDISLNILSQHSLNKYNAPFCLRFTLSICYV
ncbi:hypothetical protein PR202_ga02465 [Eleusine coracana subsp. coracana]|uniref:Uncharacterized protein n=1 Tax=Eleusine coracana subsp. coracana TaxID=191504 RepID=A0AAV5BJJ2_ELECO|nr:hypothetical protein PR202_ga02465 [Eleusine coracana subsp. coracana]